MLQENGLQNKLFTKKQKEVYKTSLSPKSILHENDLPNKLFTKKHFPWKRSAKQAFHQKKRKGLHTRKTNIQENNLITKQTFHQTAFSMKTFYKTSLSPKNILHENGLQNKPFTKEHSPRKWSTKQTVHQKKISKNTVYKTSLSPKKRSTKQTFHQKKFSKKSVYKTNCSPKKHLQKNGLQNKPSTKKNSRKRSTKKALATNVPQENAQHKGLGHKKCGRSNHMSDM